MNFNGRPSVLDQAQGKWRGVLLNFGIPEVHLRNRHGPCPLCGGRDRFRYDDKDGTGTWICSVCGAGRGMDLLMQFRGWDFKTAAQEVEQVIGAVSGVEVRQEMSDEQRRLLRIEVWKGTTRTAPGDVVDRYLTERGVGEPVVYPPALRTHACLRYAADLFFPALVALVVDQEGKAVNLHRTYLGEAGKAPVDDPRKMMPGALPEGACVRLSDPQDCIGIAEGIETALAASHRFQMPVWSAINATLLGKWWPPVGVSEVVVFGDNDLNFTGQSAAYSLARRLAMKSIRSSVCIPSVAGSDWADQGATA